MKKIILIILALIPCLVFGQAGVTMHGDAAPRTSFNQLYQYYGGLFHRYMAKDSLDLFYTPLTRSLTINGVTQDLSTNRTFTVSSITGNAGTVTNGVYTTTFNGLGDARYLQLTGGTLSGNLNGITANFSSDITASGGNILFNNNFAGNGISWAKNTDFAKIYFESNGDTAGDSNQIFEVGDNIDQPAEGWIFRKFQSPTTLNILKLNQNELNYSGAMAKFVGVNASSLTASQAVFTDASKNLVSNAVTGTGNVVMSASPTLTGTVTIPTPTFSTTATTAINQEYLPSAAPVILATVTGIDTKVSAVYGLYTVPSGKTAVITAVMVRCTSATSITNGPTVEIKSGATIFYPNVALDTFQNFNDVYGFSTVGMNRALPAASGISMDVTATATGTAQTVEVTLIGYLR